MNKVNSAVHYAVDREEYAKHAKVNQCWPADFLRRNLNGTKHTAARSGRCLPSGTLQYYFMFAKRCGGPLMKSLSFEKNTQRKQILSHQFGGSSLDKISSPLEWTCLLGGGRSEELDLPIFISHLCENVQRWDGRFGVGKYFVWQIVKTAQVSLNTLPLNYIDRKINYEYYLPNNIRFWVSNPWQALY